MSSHSSPSRYTSSYHEHEHGGEHGHGHVKIGRYAKVLIVMECPWSLYSYNFRYLLGYKGSFYSVFPTDDWVYYCNVGLFVASLLAVFLAVLTDSYCRKYTVLVVGFLLSTISGFIIFAVAAQGMGQYEKLLNTVGLFWGLLFITVEPVRVAVFFDQLPDQMDPHTCAHVFLMYQEMKTLGSILYVILNGKLGGKVYGKTPLPLALIYFCIPVLYLIVIIGFWRVSHPGESNRGIGINCISCFGRAVYLKFFKRIPQDGHLLDIARDAFDAKTIRNAKIMCSLIFVFNTLITYGMVQNLSKENWLDQSQNLIEDVSLKKYYQDINMVFFVLTILLLPFIEDFLLPQIYKRRKYGKPFTELQRIGITVFVTGAAFLSTTILQLGIEKYASILPSRAQDRAQVRLFNLENETVWVSGNWVFETTNISGTNMLQAWHLKSHRTTLYRISVKSAPNATGHSAIDYTSFMATVPGESLSYLITKDELLQVHGFDPIVFGPEGTNVNDMVRIYLINYVVVLLLSSVDGTLYHIPLLSPGDEIRFRNLNPFPVECSKGAKQNVSITIPDPFDRTTFQLCPGDYEIECPRVHGINVWGDCLPNHNVSVRRGGIYAILPIMRKIPIKGAPGEFEEFKEFKIFTVCNPAQLSIYLMLPQVVLQAFAVAMGKIPINIFLFKESPRETRVSTLALYYFTQDGSSIIFAIFSNVFHFRVDSYQLVMVTGIHMVFCFFFAFAALKHQKFPEDDGGRRRRAMYGSTVIE